MLPPEASLILAAALAGIDAVGLGDAQGLAHGDQVGRCQDVVEELDDVAAAGAADVAVLAAGEGEQDRLRSSKRRIRCPDKGAQGSRCRPVAAAGDRSVHECGPLRFGEGGHELAGGRFGGGGVNDRDGSRCRQELRHGGFHDAGRGQGEDRVRGPGEIGKVGSGGNSRGGGGGPGCVGGVETGDSPAGLVERGGHCSAHGAEAYDGYAAVGAGVHELLLEKIGVGRGWRSVKVDVQVFPQLLGAADGGAAAFGVRCLHAREQAVDH